MRLRGVCSACVINATSFPHSHALTTFVGRKCVLCVCMNVCDIQSRVARVTCGDLNEVNNLLHLFHLPSSCYCAHIHSMRAISHHRPVIRCFTYMNFPQFHVVRDDYICGGRGAEVSFCGIRGMQHRGDFTLVMQKPDIFVSTLQSGDNLKKNTQFPISSPKDFVQPLKVNISEILQNPPVFTAI